MLEDSPVGQLRVSSVDAHPLSVGVPRLPSALHQDHLTAGPSKEGEIKWLAFTQYYSTTIKDTQYNWQGRGREKKGIRR